jgi:dCTP deaminase
VPPNSFARPAKIYANEGIAQVLFFQSDEVCTTSCRDRKGRCQAQIDVTLPRI